MLHAKKRDVYCTKDMGGTEGEPTEGIYSYGLFPHCLLHYFLTDFDNV